MKRLSWAIVLPFVLLCVAHADSIPMLNVVQPNYSFFANGGGDNAEYSLVGPGIHLHGVGSANCFPSEFCNEGVPLTPGTFLVPNVSVDFESSSGTVTIGGQTFRGPEEVGLFISSINAGGFRFPIVPRATFTVTVPAAFAAVHGEVADGTIFGVNIPPGKLVLTFTYVPAINSFYFTNGVFTTAPEPGTLSLMVTGLGLILAGIRRKRSQAT